MRVSELRSVLRCRFDICRLAQPAALAGLCLTLAAAAAAPAPTAGPSPPAVEEVTPVAGRCAAAFGAAVDAELDRGRRRQPYSAETLAFTLRFQDEASPYRLMSMFLLPGETVTIEAEGNRRSRFAACADGGELGRTTAGAWSWQAPSAPGRYRLYVTDESAGETARLNAFVLRPYGGGASIGGFRVGSYERVPLRGDPAYSVPRGMVEVGHRDAAEIWLSPHFQLRQFLCKQSGGYPKYLVLQTRMLLKLEALLERVNRQGIEADTFAVLSGYRTPWYNASIGNKTRYSRHTYGDAADIYIDQNGDGRMDDLDGDGRETVGDAVVLRDLVESSTREAWYRPFVGGMGLYGPKPQRGPFVHVDTRGYPARW